MNTLSIGKIRGLQQSATRHGALSVLALDHRGALRQAMRPSAPDTVTPQDLVQFKVDVMRALSPAASAVLLDPEFGIAQCIRAGAVAGTTGLVATLEATGYTGDPIARHSRVLPGWNADRAKRSGATAAKLLVYYHPDSSMAKDMETLVKEVAADCAAHNLALFIEPLSYSPDPNKKKLSSDERRYVVIETARRLTPLGGDVLKAEFPLDIAEVTNESEWAAACAELSKVSLLPWVLLSASSSFETFLRQVTIACQAGASGVAVGRAVWREAATLVGQERLDFLQQVGLPRMARITELCDALARPWTDFYAAPQVASNWYASY